MLLPMFILAVLRRPEPRHWQPRPPGQPQARERALVGQLVMVAVGVGLLIGGITISVVGLTGVFVPSDLTFLHTQAAELRASNPRLAGFTAHDRAGFGGALASAAVAITLISAWGWRRGETWVWWTLALGALTGFGTTIVIHLAIGYTDAGHLGPVVLAAVLTGTALALSRRYLNGRN